MKPVFAYSIAAALFLAAVPIYRYIIERGSRQASAPVVASRPRPPVGAPAQAYDRAQVDAAIALANGRARCVAGVFGGFACLRLPLFTARRRWSRGE